MSSEVSDQASDQALAPAPGERLRAMRALHEQRGDDGDELYAIVSGEAFTQLPTDLYIPPDALEVFLETFEGPLDLLLYLIRRQNLDILDIKVAEITRQYMQYIELMTALQWELAAEYLVMAALLAEIKSRMLLPRPSFDLEDEDDPRAQLIRRLQEYERFKGAAEQLDAVAAARARRVSCVCRTTRVDASAGGTGSRSEGSAHRFVAGTAPCRDVHPPCGEIRTAVGA